MPWGNYSQAGKAVIHLENPEMGRIRTRALTERQGTEKEDSSALVQGFLEAWGGHGWGCASCGLAPWRSQRLSHTKQEVGQRDSGRPIPGQTVTKCDTQASLHPSQTPLPCCGITLPWHSFLPGLVEQAILKAPSSSYVRLYLEGEEKVKNYIRCCGPAGFIQVAQGPESTLPGICISDFSLMLW